MNNLEYTGQWWIPSDENNKLFGVLKFSQNDGFRLELLGKFDKNFYEIIVGETNKGEVSLFNCLQILETNIYSSNRSKTYSINYVFLGQIFSESLENLKFNKFRVGYSFLSEWSKRSKLEEKEDDKSYTFKYIFEDNLSTTWKDYKLTLTQCFNTNENITEINHTFPNYFLIETSEKTIYELEREIIKPLRNFLDIVTNRHNLITLLEIYLDDKKTIIVRGHQDLIDNKNYRYKQLFPLQDFETRFETIINSWLELEQNIGWLIDLYCDVQYSRSYLSDTARFIFMWQCLEGFYRNIVNTNNTNNITSEIIIKYFLEKDKFFILNSLLSFSYKKDKINHILKQYNKKLPEKIIATRNFYTHHFEEEGKQILHGEQIFRVSYLLSFLFLYSLLSELKFEEQEIKYIINKESTWLYLKEIFPTLELLK